MIPLRAISSRVYSQNQNVGNTRLSRPTNLVKNNMPSNPHLGNLIYRSFGSRKQQLKKQKTKIEQQTQRQKQNLKEEVMDDETAPIQLDFVEISEEDLIKDAKANSDWPMSNKIKQTEITRVSDAPDLEKHVGHVLLFEDIDLKKYFPEGPGGTFGKKDLSNINKGKTFGLLVREQTLNLLNQLKEAQSKNFIGEDLPSYFLLDGKAGAGKSGIMNQIVYWARREGWLVVFVPNAKQMCGGDFLVASGREYGMYDTPQIATEFCRTLLAAHSDKLSKIPLKLPFTITRFERTPESTLADLLTHGAADLLTSADAVYHFRRELNLVTEYPVLIAIDGINHLEERSSTLLDPDDQSLRPEFISPSKLTVPRAFLNYNTPGLLNGTVIAATSHWGSATYNFAEKSKDHPRVEVPHYNLDEFKQIMHYYQEHGYFVSSVPGRTRDLVYYLTEGNGDQVFRYCSTF